MVAALGVLVASSMALAPAALAAQQDPAGAPARPAAGLVRVVTKDSPPFAFRGDDGEWTGISIELLDLLAKRLDARLEIDERPTVEELVVALERGEADLAIAAISVTRDREARVDFSHPYYASGLGVAVREGSQTGFGSLLRALTSWAFVRLLGGIVLALLLLGVVFWLLERRRNPQYRDAAPKEAIGTGLWWSTILLFGHKGIFPATPGGRLLAAASMFASILLLSVLTGAIASMLTIGQLESQVRGVDDLRRMRTTTVAGTSSEEFLRQRRVPFTTAATPRAGLAVVREGRADAVLYDAPMLQWLVHEEHRGDLHVLPRTFDVQDYAIAFPLGSGLRKRVNQELLEIRSGPRWAEVLFRFLGQ